MPKSELLIHLRVFKGLPDWVVVVVVVLVDVDIM